MSAPAPPAEAELIFGPRLGLAVQYAHRLADEAVVRGLIGPAEVPRLWSRHLLNCAVLGELVPRDVTVLDVGSGAGLPGIPLAIARPDLSVVLVEPLLRRSSWLDLVVAALQLDPVRVLRARAEDVRGRLSAPVVIARAVAPMGRLARWCLPLLEPGGELLAMKGRSAEAELVAAVDELRRLGAVTAEVVAIGRGRLPDPTSVVRVRVGTGVRPGGQPGGDDDPSASRPGRSKQQVRQRIEGGGG
jgi:16S rRNA (guanine527-N7)-methyltransferase